MAYTSLQYFACAPIVGCVPSSNLWNPIKIIAHFIHDSKSLTLIKSAKNCPMNSFFNLMGWFPKILIFESLFRKFMFPIYDLSRFFI
jgi:hypothetical protein